MTITSTASATDAVKVGQLKLHVLSGGSGDPVVIVHDDIGNHGWHAFHEELARGVQVVAPDLPGYGLSERPEWARNVRDEAILMNLFLDQQGYTAVGSVSLVGVGYGGWLAAEMATMNQRRIRKMVLVGPAGLRPQPGDEILDQFLMIHEEYVKAGFHSRDAFERHFTAQAPVEQLVTWDINREMTSRIAFKPYMYNDGLGPLLEAVDTDVLLVWGEQDRVVPPSCAVAYQSVLKNSRLSVVQDCGHRVDLERPDELAALILSHIR